MKKNWLGALVALGMMGAGAAPAKAGDVVTVPGCYGAVIIVCDPTISTQNIEITQEEHPVCVGSCVTVPIPGVETGGPAAGVCTSYRRYGGGTWTGCSGAEYHDRSLCVYQESADTPLGSQVCTPRI